MHERMGAAGRSLVILAISGGGMLLLAGCADASGRIQEVGAQTMQGVSMFSLFAAVALALYWITYVILFGLRNVWPEGYNQIQSTWKPAAFLTAATIIGLPALLAWANGVVQSGGFGGR